MAEENVENQEKEDELQNVVGEETDEGQETQENVVPKTQFEGLKKDLIAKRQELQAYKSQMQIIQQQNEQMQQRMKTLETKSQDERMKEVLGIEEDEEVTGAKLINAYKRMKQAEQAEQQKTTRQQKINNLNSSMNQMRIETQDQAKYGLDWDSVYPVINRIYAQKKMENPGFEEFLLNERNPAKYLYDLALEQPELKERAATTKNEKVLKGMENRKKDKSIAANSKGKTPEKPLKLDDFAGMSPEQIVAKMKEADQAILAGAKKKR